jgi:hypothetical protein
MVQRQQDNPSQSSDSQIQTTLSTLSQSPPSDEDDIIHVYSSSDHVSSRSTSKVLRSGTDPQFYKPGRDGQSSVEDSHDGEGESDSMVGLVTQSENGGPVLSRAIKRTPHGHGALAVSASEHSNHKHSLAAHKQSHSSLNEEKDFGAAVQTGYGDQLQSPIQVLRNMAAWSEHYRFPSRADCEEVREKADTLPDMVFVPFEDAVADMELMGWEDLWVSKARYAGPKLAEPKIDFVYNCKQLFICDAKLLIRARDQWVAIRTRGNDAPL